MSKPQGSFEDFRIWFSVIGCSRNRKPRTSKTEGARTQRALSRGTAKRLSHKHAKPRPVGRVLGRLYDGLGKFAVFGTARSQSYAKFIFFYSLNSSSDDVMSKIPDAARFVQPLVAMKPWISRPTRIRNDGFSIREIRAIRGKNSVPNSPLSTHGAINISGDVSSGAGFSRRPHLTMACAIVSVAAPSI
jgi:hypothetical protein